MRRARDSTSTESYSRSSDSSSNRGSKGSSGDYTFGQMINVRENVREENSRLSTDSVFESESGFSSPQNWIEKTLVPEPNTVESLQLPPSGQNGHKMSIGSEMSHGSANTDRLLKSSLINGPRTGPRKSVRMLEDIETSDIPIKIK